MHWRRPLHCSLEESTPTGARVVSIQAIPGTTRFRWPKTLFRWGEERHHGHGREGEMAADDAPDTGRVMFGCRTKALPPPRWLVVGYIPTPTWDESRSRRTMSKLTRVCRAVEDTDLRGCPQLSSFSRLPLYRTPLLDHVSRLSSFTKSRRQRRNGASLANLSVRHSMSGLVRCRFQG